MASYHLGEEQKDTDHDYNFHDKTKDIGDNTTVDGNWV